MDGIVEIAGRDSIAAALKFCQENKVEALLPTYVHTGTEYGDFSEIKANVSSLKKKLVKDYGVSLLDLVELSNPSLWWAINGRFVASFFKKFGFWIPCLGCHLYLHLMRAPLAKQLGCQTIISGEREYHGKEVKLNQTKVAIDAYSEVLSSIGLTLALPIRHIQSNKEIKKILGEDWEGGTRQLSCVLSGNYRLLDSSNCLAEDMGEDYIKRYLVPVGKRLAQALLAGEEDHLQIVGEVLGGA